MAPQGLTRPGPLPSPPTHRRSSTLHPHHRRAFPPPPRSPARGRCSRDCHPPAPPPSVPPSSSRVPPKVVARAVCPFPVPAHSPAGLLEPSFRLPHGLSPRHPSLTYTSVCPETRKRRLILHHIIPRVPQKIFPQKLCRWCLRCAPAFASLFVAFNTESQRRHLSPRGSFPSHPPGNMKTAVRSFRCSRMLPGLPLSLTLILRAAVCSCL